MDKDRFEIYYVRHGSTEGAGIAGRDKCDIDLSDEGIRQAELLAERLKGQHFDAVFSSPLIRAVRTAAAVTDALAGENKIEIIPALTENGTENYAGPYIDLLRQYSAKVCMCHDDVCAMDAPGSERADEVIKYLRRRFGSGQRILVFAHGTFGTDFLSSALGIKNSGFIFSLDNTSVSKIKYTSDGKVRLSFSNDVSHLRSLRPHFDEEV